MGGVKLPGHAGHFFAKYPSYNYDNQVPVWDAFDSLVDQMRWCRIGKNKTYLNARAELRRALVLNFNYNFATNAQRLEAWQNLCEALGIETIPKTITQCRKAVENVHVNLRDLVDYLNAGDETAELRKFKSAKALQKYTRKNKKIFPKVEAKACGMLKFLLRPIIRPIRR